MRRARPASADRRRLIDGCAYWVCADDADGGESKRGYAFGVRVSVDGGEPLLVTVEPTEPAHVQMEDVLLEQCGLD